jgi:PAS domain S-box-containing protein
MKSSSTALGQRFTGFAANNFHSVESPDVFERIVFRYGLAALSVAIALGVKLILLHFNFPYPLSTSFLLAIAITFWYAGTGPGILSVLLSFVAFALFVIPNQVDYRIILPDGSTKPVYVSGVTASHIQYFFYFALLALLMSWFSSSRRRAEQSLSQARRELETKVEERTAKLSRTNEELQTEIIERKSAEEKLRRSEAFLTEGQRISHTGSWSWSVSSGKVAWSQEHFRIFGYDPEKTQASYQLFLETVHPEDRSTIEQNLDRAVREKSGFDMEFRIALADGSIKHVQGLGRPVLGESGEVDHYTGTTVDISERKRGEALFAGEKRLLEMIATGVALEEILNALSLIIEEYRRGTLASVLLLRADGVHLDSVAGPSLPKAWIQQMEKLPIGPCAGSCGTAAYRGAPVIVSDIETDPLWDVPEHRAAALKHGLRASWSNPILSSEGKVLGTLCIYSRETRAPEPQDLGLMEKASYLARVAIERDRAEAALRTSQQKYRDLINASPDAVCVIDADSRYVLVNPAGTKLVGRPEHELIGRSIADTYIEEDRHLLKQRIEKLKAEGSLRFERKFVRASGEVIPVEVSLSTLRGRYYQAIIRDIS